MNIRGERILILGDSLSSISPYSATKATVLDLTPSTPGTGSPGATLGKNLLGVGAQAVRINARVGRSAIDFTQGTEPGQHLMATDLADFKPTKVIVFLGTNDINRGVTPDALARTAAAFIEIRDTYRSNGAEVFAFGPPMYLNPNYAQNAPTMLDTIRKVFGADRTLDLRPLTTGVERSKDGVHFTQVAAHTVAKRVLAQLPMLGQLKAIAKAAGTKIALGVVGFGGLVGLTWLTVHLVRRADHRKALSTALSIGRTAGRWFARRA